MENKVVLGIIVDVSSSMKRNFSKISYSKSRIDVVREAINEEFRKIVALRKISQGKKIDVFCLGIGFKSSLSLSSYSIEDGVEMPTGNSEKLLIGNICDIITLTNLIPGPRKIDELRNKVFQFWENTSSEFINKNKSNEYSSIDLKDFVFEQMISRSTLELHISTFLDHLRIFKRTLLNRRSKRLEFSEFFSKKYVEKVELKSKALFSKYSSKYDDLIKETITSFARIQILAIIEKNTLGFPIEMILEEFDFQKLELLSKRIHSEIEADLRKEINLLWIEFKMKIWIQNLSYLGNCDLKSIEEKTEEMIKSHCWKEIGPYVELQVSSIFERLFIEAIDNSMSNWIQLSSEVQTTIPIDEIDNLFPESNDFKLYSDDYVFGATPMGAAVRKAAIRFNQNEYNDCEKYLLIISDGEFENMSSISWTTNLLKRRGVIIGCGLISKNNVLNKFQMAVRSTTIDGAKNLMEIASRFGDTNLDFRGQKILANDNSKICLRLSRPRIIKEMLRIMVGQ